MSNKPNIKELRNMVQTFKDFVKFNEQDGKKTAKELEERMKIMIPELYNKFSNVAKLFCRKDNTQMLEKMIDGLEEVEKGKVSLKQKEKELGEELAETYVYPLVKNDKKDKKDKKNKK